LAFSKNVENHIGAIRYFICDYNLARAALAGCCHIADAKCPFAF